MTGAATDRDADVVTLLTEILCELRALPAAIATAMGQGHKSARLSRADAIALAALLPVIAAAVGNRTFLVGELIEHSKLKIETSIALANALESIGNSRKIGRLLRRALDSEIDGFRVAADGEVREGMLWTVTAITRKTRTAH